MRISLSDGGSIRSVVSGLEGTGQAAERALMRTINTVAAKTATAAKREIASEINLPAGYIGERMRLEKASRNKLVAVLTARNRPVRLARFGASQITRAAKAAKGDGLRGIAAGRKQAGVSVKVARAGQRKRMPGAFLLPLRAGKSDGANGMGVFVREGSAAARAAARTPGVQLGKSIGAGGIRHLYGPSPHQLLKRLRPKLIGQIERQFRDLYLAQLRFERTGSRK